MDFYESIAAVFVTIHASSDRDSAAMINPNGTAASSCSSPSSSPIRCSTTRSSRCCATNSDGGTIPGLFATGELVGGIFWFNYPGGTSLMNGSVFGKIAGTTAGQRAKQSP